MSNDNISCVKYVYYVCGVASVDIGTVDMFCNGSLAIVDVISNTFIMHYSLQRFVRGTSSFACEMAEAILNGLTSNKHRLLKEKLTEQRDKLFHMSQQQQQQQQQPQQPVQQQQQQPQQETRQPKQEGQEGQQPKQEEQQQQLEQGGQQQKQKEQEERKESQSDEKHSADQQITAGADMNEKDTMSTTTTVAITNITAATNPVTTTTTTATTGSVQQEK